MCWRNAGTPHLRGFRPDVVGRRGPEQDEPLVLLYNPRVASPGYHRLPHSLLQLGALLEGRYPYAIVDGNLSQERDHAADIIQQARATGARYLGVTIMPGPQLQRAVPDIRRIKGDCPDLTIIAGGYFPTSHAATCAPIARATTAASGGILSIETAAAPRMRSKTRPLVSRNG